MNKHFSILVREVKGVKTLLVDTCGNIVSYPSKKLAQAAIDDPRHNHDKASFKIIDMSD